MQQIPRRRLLDADRSRPASAAPGLRLLVDAAPETGIPQCAVALRERLSSTGPVRVGACPIGTPLGGSQSIRLLTSTCTRPLPGGRQHRGDAGHVPMTVVNCDRGQGRRGTIHLCHRVAAPGQP